MRVVTALIVAGLLFSPGFAWSQPESPHTPNERTLLLDHFDTPFTPDGRLMTAPAIITPAGEFTGGRPPRGAEFVPGRFGSALRLHGLTAMHYPAPGNIDISAGSVSFWVQMGFEPRQPSEMPGNLRNQLLLHVDPPGTSIFSIYSTMVNLCVGVWDERGQLAAYIGTPSPWHEGEWHHVEVRWGRQLELWMDGERCGVKDWVGLFGPMNADLAQTQLYVGSRVGYSDVVSEFAIDELCILGPGGEQVPPRPVLTCPRAATPPTIDGTLAPGEWDDAGATTGFVGLNDPRPVLDQTRIFVSHDATNLYIAAELTDPENRPIVATFTERDAAVYQEDAFDIFLRPGPDEHSYYQLVANALGTRFDMRLYDENGRRTQDPGFNPDWRVATARIEGGWALEAAIPWSELEGRAAPEPGTSWRVNFCRDADAAGRLSSWAYTAGNFHRPATFGELIFRADDRAMRLSELSGLRDGRVHVRLDLTGRAFDPPVTVTASLMDATAAAIAEVAKELVDAKSFAFDPPPITSGDYVLTLSAASSEGQMCYQRLPFTVDKPFDIAVAGYPYEGRLWVTANVGGMGALPEGARVRAALTAGEREFGACAIAAFDRGRGEGAIDITQLPAGQYEVRAQVLGADGAALAEAAAGFEQFDRPRFWMSEAGTERTVPVPWTPVELTAEVVRVWGREYRGGRILPAQIVNQGREILAGAPTLTTTIGGDTVDLAGLAARTVEAAEDRAVQEATAQVGGATVTVRATTEFDGLARYDLTIDPGAGAIVEGLALAVPVRREFATFLLPSNGRFAQAQVIGDEPWLSAFIPQVWVGNDDLGLAWFAESDRHWRPVDDPQMLAVTRTGDTVTIAANIIRRPLTLTGPITITFGLMATPVKPVPSGDPWLYRLIGPTNAFELYDPEKSTFQYVERLTYPTAGNLDPRRGTLEFRLSRGGRDGGSWREIAAIIGDGGSLRVSYSAESDHLQVNVQAGDQASQLGADNAGIPLDGFAPVALTWGDGAASLYANGRRLATGEWPAAVSEQMAAAPEKLQLIFGVTHSYRGWTWFALDEVRVSGDARYTGESYEVTDAPFTADAQTLLLDHLDERFCPDGEDAETRATVISGQSGELGGVPSIGCEFVDGAFGAGLRVPVQSPRWCVEQLRAWGGNAYNVWSWLPPSQQAALGWPLPLFTEPEGVDLPRMNAAFDEAGIRTSTYMGYMGIGAPTRWSRQFGFEWRREPVSSQPAEPPPGHFFLDCCGNARGYRDYLAAGTGWLLDEQGFDGCYTDGNAHVYPCRNTHHGCGYYAEDGTLRPTYPVFGTRDYLQRMYRLIHARDPEGFLVNHVSYNIFIPTMSFTDLYYTGEHEHYEDLVKARVRWQGTQWGIWPILLGADSHTYEAMYYTYTLLHGSSVWCEGPIGRNDMQRKTVNLWRAYDDFGYREAQWVPYYRAQESGLARTGDEQVLASVYLKPGAGAFMIVGNLRHEVVETEVTVDRAQMGLGGDIRAWNALDGRALPLTDGRIAVRLRPTSFVLVRVGAR